MKPINFVGAALSDLKAFPNKARREAGFQISNVQSGFEPDDWKPMTVIGQGVKEIRIHEEGEFRVIYFAKMKDAIFVLHAFQKKTQKTRKRNIELAKARFKELKRDRRME